MTIYIYIQDIDDGQVEAGGGPYYLTFYNVLF